MLTNRRSSEGSGAWPVISRRQENAGCFPSATRSSALAMAVTAGLMPSSVVFPRRTPSIDCEIAPRTPCSVGSAARVPRNGCALINCAMSLFTSSTDLKRMPLRAKNSPPSGRVTVRITSGWARERVGQRRGRLFGALGRRRVDDGDDPVGPLGEEVVEPHLLLAPGERARQELAAVGVDGDVARKIEAGEDRRDEEARNDEPRVAGR